MDGEDDRIENSKAERDSEVTRRAQQCGTRIAAKCGAAKSILLICNLSVISSLALALVSLQPQPHGDLSTFARRTPGPQIFTSTMCLCCAGMARPGLLR
jgi:hypothetical protein